MVPVASNELEEEEQTLPKVIKQKKKPRRVFKTLRKKKKP